jgi:hypothetical protein
MREKRTTVSVLFAVLTSLPTNLRRTISNRASILGGKCLNRRVLGEGGFGHNLYGWDLNLDLKLAIKEYYPTGFVTAQTPRRTP